ncbi:hypothetical protein BU17DRAFT_53814 [Hysterangium stoloniferum]|nr:hypothetical protein BU17DRAFT_53814 [Hysterangium stoloniferum]
MAHQAFPGYAGQQLNKGTLAPGQTVLVNQYTVQIERYLSQGGFAHVYVVRSAAPVNNTTQHVLKRIAVADQAMLMGVQKEVEVMRTLRGHPNIVNFIDASWHTLPNGTYEVFILMELCPGGGIIDMMNRRLRERLTEAEILQIFVDVCESLAYMHSMKPPLLHRDVKVENILQSSATLYKLCDFGSSTTVAARPPSTTQEIRALEADINRHTTLQYRAPEMVDVYGRRPIDEKSDVWALGVLLYKLCYYTTPFEEHGPLAILHVQYRIPSYPVYSNQMNDLIGTSLLNSNDCSMLREFGNQRPSVFEILDTVHRLRGTKSPYHYKLPTQHPLSMPPLENKPSGGLNNIVSVRPSPAHPSNPSAAILARQNVLDAIAPMRRGRPTNASPTRTVQDETAAEAKKLEEQWNAVKTTDFKKSADDAWDLSTAKTQDKTTAGPAFDGFGDSFSDQFPGKASLSPSPAPGQPRRSPVTGNNIQKDAFDGLGGIARPQNAPTLGEVAKFGKEPVRPPLLKDLSRAPVPPPSSGAPLSPRMYASRTGLATYRPITSLSAEERFPSLDELDKTWRPPGAVQVPPAASTFQPGISPIGRRDPSPRVDGDRRTPVSKPSAYKQPSSPIKDESRSQPVTGTAMHSPQVDLPSSRQHPSSLAKPRDAADKAHMPIGSSPTKYRPTRPALARKSRSSVSMKSPVQTRPPQDWLTGDEPTPETNVLSPLQSMAQDALQRKSPEPYKHWLDHKTFGKVSDSQSNSTTKSALPPSPINAEESSKRFSVFRRPSPTPQEQTARNGAPQKHDSSSDEGPEDVDSHVVSSRQQGRGKGRQSSVHDLVDLYGGSRIPISRERADPPPLVGQKERRTSGSLVDLSSPAPATASSLLSPTSIVPESRAELAGLKSGTASIDDKTNTTGGMGSKELRSRPISRTPPGSSPSIAKLKPRPQSMFMLPPRSPTESGGSGLRPPPEETKPRRAARRGSISDMVDLYEGLNANSRLKEAPPITTKPAALRSATPSPVLSRFPALSPTGTSFPPALLKTTLDPPQLKPKPRRSPTTSSFTSLVNPVKVKDVSRVPRRQSVSPAKASPLSPVVTDIPATASKPAKPAKPASLSIPIPSNSVNNTVTGLQTPITEQSISSPSPERPYQGVSKLIDQWQRKTEEADTSRRPGSRPVGRRLGARLPVGRRETGQED